MYRMSYKHDLPFTGKWMNAAGMLGYCPAPKGPLENAGAFITNPVSGGARTPASGPRLLAYPGGLLLHSGLPNPGLEAVIRQYGRRWARQRVPVIVHLVGETPASVTQMALRLERTPGVGGLELGLPPGIAAAEAEALTRAAAVELPCMVRLPLDQALELAPAVLRAGAAALSLGPPRGMLPVPQGGPQGGWVSGRLYGPALYPQALEMLRALVSLGLPVVGGCGVYTPAQAEAMLAAGAVAVQLDTVLWKEGWTA